MLDIIVAAGLQAPGAAGAAPHASGGSRAVSANRVVLIATSPGDITVGLLQERAQGSVASFLHRDAPVEPVVITNVTIRQ